MKSSTILEFSLCHEDNKIYRGCLTDNTEARLLCGKDDGDHCVKCETTGCNDVPRIRSPSLSCITCNQTDECAFGHRKKSATDCVNDVKLGSYESCYTFSHPSEFEYLAVNL